MSSNSNSSSSSYSLSPPASLSQYSTVSSSYSSSSSSSSNTMSSGIGSSTCQSPPTSTGHFSSLGTEDSNFGDLSNVVVMVNANTNSANTASGSSFANFRDTVQLNQNQRQEEVEVEQEQQLVQKQAQQSTTITRASKRSSQQVIFYNHSPKIRKADRDPVFLENRCLANLFELEEQLYHTTRGHMKGEINDQMRRIVAGWMMEVSDKSDSLLVD